MDATINRYQEKKVKNREYVQGVNLHIGMYIDANTASNYLRISHQTGTACIRKLKEPGILDVYAARKRNIVYKARGILNVLGA
jgi:Fic family protein